MSSLSYEDAANQAEREGCRASFDAFVFEWSRWEDRWRDCARQGPCAGEECIAALEEASHLRLLILTRYSLDVWNTNPRPRSPPAARTGRTALYRHYGSDGRLLYVGVSVSLLSRTGEHRASRWFHLIKGITVEYFSTREEALAAEELAIRTEFPRFNIKGRLH